MYCISEDQIKTMSAETLHERQRLFEEVLPQWEYRIFKVAVATLPKVDQGLMEIADVQQEIRWAIWEAVCKFDPERGMNINSWIFNIINQASSQIAKLMYHNMPHNEEGHAMQLLRFFPETSKTGFDCEETLGEHRTDPNSIGRIEESLMREECIELIRPAMNAGFETEVFDMFMEGYTGGEIAKDKGATPARVSAVRIKMKVAYVLLYGLPLEKASEAQNVGDLEKRVKHKLALSKRSGEARLQP